MEMRQLRITVGKVGVYGALGLNTVLLELEGSDQKYIVTTLGELKKALCDIGQVSTLPMQSMWDIYQKLAPKLVSDLRGVSVRITQRAAEIRLQKGEISDAFRGSGDYGHFVNSVGMSSPEIRSFEAGLQYMLDLHAQEKVEAEVAILLLDELLNKANLPLKVSDNSLKDMRPVEVVIVNKND